MLSFLQSPKSPKALAIFRIAFGFLMLFQFSKLKKRIAAFEDPGFLYFPYPELDWMPVIHYEAMNLLWIVGIIATIGMTAGFLFRICTVLTALIYGYFFSLDALYFNNHYYLIFLLTVLLAFTQADLKYSIRSLKNKKAQWVPYWQYGILQLQICIVFFYGGLSKCSKDWFDGNIIRDIFESDFLNQFLIYGGAIFDLLIPFALFYKKTRWIAIILVIAFNVSNHFIFDDIASFPLLVIASMLLFLVDGGMPSFIQKIFPQPDTTASLIPWKPLTKYSLLLFFAFQFLFPLRHHLIPGHVDWTGQGHYFAWRMKSYAKEASIDLYAFDNAKKRRAYKLNLGLDPYQVQRISSMPHMILRLSANVRQSIEKQDGVNPNLGISADYKVRFNFRDEKMAIDPNYDISRVSFSKYGKNPWIIE